MLALENVHELLDLIAVNGFYTEALQQKLGHAIPLPKEAVEAGKHGAKTSLESSIQTLRRWLSVLDLAIEPLVIRDAMKESMPQETAEALLRYYIEKHSLLQNDRDKTDCVTTFLLKRAFEDAHVAPEVDRYFYLMEQAKKFQAQIRRMIGEEARIPELRSEHAQLLREFEFLHQEVEDFRTFDQLMDSGIVARVRDVKQSFQQSFYHPEVLANVAVYNWSFGRRFDELFRAAAEQIKNYAHRVQSEGASIMSRVEGDVTVKHLADAADENVLNQEYGKAQEHLRKVSHLKKVVDKKAKSQTGTISTATVKAAVSSTRASSTNVPSAIAGSRAASAIVPPLAPSGTPGAVEMQGVRPVADAEQESKLKIQLEALRTFARVQARSCSSIPLTRGILAVSETELDSLKADYGTEKSFRADYANQMAYLLTMTARVIVEMADFQDKQGSSYLWKPQADAITFIMRSSDYAIAEAARTSKLASQRGLDDKVNAMGATVSKLRNTLQQAANLLGSAGALNG